MTRTAKLASPAFDGTFKQYVAHMRRFTLLQPGEDVDLARRFREHGDRRALDRMVGSHLRLVVKSAIKYRGYGLPLDELVSEGSIGLVQAAERFDPDRGCRFATYAIWWIKAAMHDYIIRSLSLVKMGTTSDQRKLFFNLRKTKSRLSLVEDGDMRPDDVERIALRLGVSEREVVEMNRRLGGDLSLSATTHDGEQAAWQDRLVDDLPSQEDMVVDGEQLVNRRAALAQALTRLTERERRIFVSRRLGETPTRLAVLAEEFSISQERVRQIEFAALDKVRKVVTRGASIDDAAPAVKPRRLAAAPQARTHVPRPGRGNPIAVRAPTTCRPGGSALHREQSIGWSAGT
jgi:RNA polymerase sigma-32 factor